MADLIIVIAVLVITYATGSYIENSHYKRIRKREAELAHQPYVVDAFTAKTDNIRDMRFVDGSCVISADRFKVFLGGLRQMFGGRVSAYESLTDRARREAVIRMRQKAPDADMIVCTRIQYSEINPAQIEAIAYGTAVYIEK